MRRVSGLLPLAMISIAVAGLAASAWEASEQKAAPRVTPVTAQAAEVAGAADATALRPVEASDGDAPVRREAPPMSITTASGQQPQNDPPLQGRTFETSVPSDSAATAEPAVSYTDPEGDAFGAAGNAALSQPAFDILQVRWAPATEVDPQLHGYSSSIAVAGTPRNDGTYVTWGEFTSDVPGERCELYHVLTPGSTAFANAVCGAAEDGTRRFVGRVQGTEVTATRTAEGGTLLMATFDDSALPRELEAGGRMLFKLSAYTCPGPPDAPTGCWTYQATDVANSYDSYRI